MRRFIRWAPRAASVAALGCGVAVPLATASAAATPACTTTVNWIGLPGDGYAGGQVVQLEFSNTGKVTCTLYGHPGVAQMNAGREAAGRPSGPAPGISVVHVKRLSRSSARNRGRSAPSVAAMTTSFTLSILRLRYIVSLRGG